MAMPSSDDRNSENADSVDDENHFLLISDETVASDQPVLTDAESDNTPSLADLNTSSNNSLEGLGSRTQSQRLTFLNGLALVVSLQIGSGIFSAPSQISQHVSAPGIGILVWIVGGALVWTGAASFIELGLTITQNGGVQEYLRYCYGDVMGFLFTWTWIAITKPSSMAVISTVFANHLCHVFLPGTAISPWMIKLVAILGIGAITMVNCAGAKTGVKAATVFFVLKVTAVFSVALFGIGASLLGYGEGVKSSHGWFDSDDVETVGLWARVGNTVTALFGALYCYGGWEAIGFVVGDLENPRRDLRKIINSALAIVLIGFTSMNTALYLILPISVIRSEYTPVVEFGRHLFGYGGGVLYSLVVATSAMGALNANVFATAILCVTASRRGYFPRIFANLHYAHGTSESDYYRRVLRNWPAMIRSVILSFATMTSTLRLERNVPIYVMLMNACISSFYISIGTFNGLITFIGISMYFFLLLCTIGVIIIRIRGKTDGSERQRLTDRTWIGNPIIFSTVSGFIVVRGILNDYLQGLAIIVVLAIGFVIFRLRFRGGDL